jgi:hypothetical protein
MRSVLMDEFLTQLAGVLSSVLTQEEQPVVIPEEPEETSPPVSLSSARRGRLR